MTLSTAGYTVTGNQPLNHARILWDHLQGTVAGDGTNGDFAANDYTAQRWSLAAGANDWTLTLPAAADVDTVFISAHNLSGITFRPQYLGANATNLLTYSEEFDNAAWPKLAGGLGTAPVVTANYGLAPDGTMTADRIQLDLNGGTTSSDFSTILRATGVPAGTFTRSVWLQSTDGVSEYDVLLELSGGPIITVTGTPQRFVFTSPTVNNNIEIGLRGGTGSSDSADILAWGYQLEEGTEATSYIKTEATAVTSGWRDLTSWITPTDNSTIAILANDASGDAYSTTGVRLAVSNAAADTKVGIIRAGKALQMQRAFYGGYAPIRLNRQTEGQQAFSETGQWLGRTEKARMLQSQYNWTYLAADWYRTNFEPFARTLPLKPFGIVSNPSRMPDDVAWGWVNSDPQPQNMGVLDFMQVSLDVTGYWS